MSGRLALGPSPRRAHRLPPGPWGVPCRTGQPCRPRADSLGLRFQQSAAPACGPSQPRRCLSPSCAQRSCACSRRQRTPAAAAHIPPTRPLEGDTAGVAAGAFDVGDRSAARDLARYCTRLSPRQRVPESRNRVAPSLPEWHGTDKIAALQQSNSPDQERSKHRCSRATG